MKLTGVLKAAAAVFALAVVFSGCRKKQEVPASQTEQTEQPTTAANVDSRMRSVTTGSLVDKYTYPIMVSIPNDAKARPQYNISKADVLYEMYVEGNITRFLALYNDDIPDKVEPVRSARPYMVDIVEEWRAALVHFGGPDGEYPWSVYKRFKTAVIPNRLDGLTTGRHFERDKSKSAPDNVIVYLKAFSDEITSSPENWQPFKFSETPSTSNKEAKTVSFEYSSFNKIKYEYDHDTNKYNRFLNGAAFKDGNSGKQLSFENVVLQEVVRTDYGGHSEPVRLDMIGSGKATFYIGGKIIEGRWERLGTGQPTVYKDADGNEIKLNIGKTMVQIVTSSMTVTNG